MLIHALQSNVACRDSLAVLYIGDVAVCVVACVCVCVCLCACVSPPPTCPHTQFNNESTVKVNIVYSPSFPQSVLCLSYFCLGTRYAHTCTYTHTQTLTHTHTHAHTHTHIHTQGDRDRHSHALRPQ